MNSTGWMETDSPEFKALMAKWSAEAWKEEMQRDFDEYTLTAHGSIE